MKEITITLDEWEKLKTDSTLLDMLLRYFNNAAENGSYFSNDISNVIESIEDARKQ